MFGSVSTKQIAEALKHNMILKLINVKWIYLKGIHALGYTNVPVKLDKEVEGTIRVHTVESKKRIGSKAVFDFNH